MGFFKLLWRLFFSAPGSHSHTTKGVGRNRDETPRATTPKSRLRPIFFRRKKYRSQLEQTAPTAEYTSSSVVPYEYARPGLSGEGYYDLSLDIDEEALRDAGLPVLRTPQDLADFLGLKVTKLAWLVERCNEHERTVDTQSSHYHYRWIKKKSAGYRLLEIPKATLKAAQEKILVEILNCIDPHPCAHGFTPGKSIVSNAIPHVGQLVLLKFDLENFYPRITYSRVVATFKSLGFSREVSIWLAKLCTTAAPTNLSYPREESASMTKPYTERHLPQGAPTSPGIANLCAFGLDVRLKGLADSFGAQYTRYADDLTFSGNANFRRCLKIVIPLVEKIIRSERYKSQKVKRKIVRNNQRQLVTGVVVNERINCNRADFDRLKAILHNCIKYGADSQNKEKHPHFSLHLRGKIAAIAMLNQQRGDKLLRMYHQINW